MKMRFFRVALGDVQAEEELDRFLSSHRVIAVDRHFVAHAQTGTGTWALCVTYETAETASPIRKAKVDYREVLPPAQFAVYAELRTLRKSLAEGEGVPPYAVFTNEQLAAMVRKPVLSRDALLALPGVGEARATKYGESFLDLLRQKVAPVAERAVDGAHESGGGALDATQE